MSPTRFSKDLQYYKFCLYGFLKNQRFFELYFLLILHYEKGLSLTQFGALLSIRFIFKAVLEIPSGFIADALGRRGSMLFSYACYIGSFLLYYLSDSFILLIIPSVLFSIADAFRSGTHKAMILEYLTLNDWQNQKTDYYGHTRAWSQTGSAISAIIATAIIWFRTDYNIVFIYSLIPYCLGFILLASYPKNLEGKMVIRIPFSKVLQEISVTIKASMKAFKSLSKIKFTLGVASYTGYYSAVKDYFQLLIIAIAATLPALSLGDLAGEKKEKILLGLVYTILFFITAAASRNTQRVNALFKNVSSYLNVLLMGGILMGIGAGIAYLHNLLVLALLMFVLIYTIQNLRKPASVAIIAENFDSRILASALSIESQLSSVIGAVLSLIIGFLADRFGLGNSIIAASLFMLFLFPFFKIRKSKTV